MKIVVIGPGAMGCLYGAKLSSVPENKVYLLDIRTERADAINSHGILIEWGGEFTKYKNVVAGTDASSVGYADLVIIFVKSTATKEAVLGHTAVFGPETAVLTLQNGLGNVELISEVIGRKNVIAGTTAHGATVLGPGKVRHAGVGKSIIGELDGKRTERINAICDMFNKAGLETGLSDDVLSVIWDKLLVNTGINALVGITKLYNGELLEHPELIELLELAVTEGAEVAKAKGIKLGFDDPVSRTKDVCRATAKNKASMLQDILNHRKTEIDMINGAIVREGRKLGIVTPINLALTNLIKFIEK
jgi:2-dehydropantoate 2-reductase